MASGALLPAPALAQSAPFCGIDGQNVAALRARVSADPRFKRGGGDATREIWSSESLQAILTLTTAKASAFPAAICQQVVDNAGTMRIERQIRCEAGEAACAKLTADLDKADEGSGDEP